MNIWCHQHRELSDAHPHIAEAINAVQNPATGGVPEHVLVVRLEVYREKIANGICPFCGDALMSKADFDAWHEEWRTDHRNACYCAECGTEHTNFSRWNGINVAPCGGRWRPLGLHPTKFRNHRGVIEDISGDADKLAQHHDNIRYGVIWNGRDGSPNPIHPEEGKKYHALVKGHPVFQ